MRQRRARLSLLRALTDADVMFLWRTSTGRTQRQAAADLRWPYKMYWEVEAGERPLVEVPDLVEAEPIYWTPRIQCALARRHHGTTLRETAKMFGISHVTLIAWERNGDPRLVEGWGKLGYQL